MKEIIQTGLCVCVYQPNGDNGLEGFDLNRFYRYQEMKDSKGQYFRVYPDLESPEYFETCGPIVFKRYFNI